MKLKYIDVLPRHFPTLASHPKGIGVKKGDVIVVTEKDAKNLMLIKNGKKSVFEIQRKVEPKIIEEDDNVSR